MAQISSTQQQLFRRPIQVELGIALPLPLHTRHTSSTDPVGLALGRDYAHHGLTPPTEHLHTTSPLHQGWLAGKATFAHRTLTATRHTRRWLALRTHAWICGRCFEDVQLTPNYLQQIDVSHCPITRVALNDRRGDPHARSIDRVRDAAGYAAGNVVVMSAHANAAKSQHDYTGLNSATTKELTAEEWQRIAVLTSFVTELPHAEAALIPMVVLPPNRLRLFNPIQALQALVTRQLCTPGWSARLARLEALLPHDSLRGDFNRFVLAIAPRVLAVQHLNDAQHIRWALEDAWTQPLLQKRWARFAVQLTGAEVEELVRRAADQQWRGSVLIQAHAAERATEGWALDRRGFCSPGAAVH